MVCVGQQPAHDLAGGLIGISHEVERFVQVQRVKQQDHLVQQGSVVAVGKYRAFVEATGQRQGDGLRYVLRKNGDEAARVHHRLEDQLTRLNQKIKQRHETVTASPRCKPESGLAKMHGQGIARHKLARFIQPRLDARELRIDIDEAAREQAMLLAGCYAIVTDVAKTGMATRSEGQEERLARVRFLTLPASRKLSRRRIAGGELRLGTVATYRRISYYI